MSSMITIAAIGAATGIYSAVKSEQNAENSTNAAVRLEAKQDHYNNILKGLMDDPSTFFNNPVYTASRDQGLDAVSRKMASQGYTGSGNMATALMDYAQGNASGQLFQQEQILAGLTGLGQSAAPYYQNAQNAHSDSSNQLQSALGTLAFGMGGMGGSGPKGVGTPSTSAKVMYGGGYNGTSGGFSTQPGSWA